MALAMSLEVQRTLDYLRAVKERPRSEVGAENRLANRLRSIFDQASLAVISALDSSGIVPSNDTQRRQVLIALEEAIEELSSITEDEAIEAAQRGRNKIIDALRKNGVRGLAFDGLSKTVIDEIRSSVFTATERTMRRLIGDVKGVLEIGFQQGLGMDGVKDLLNDQFKNMRDFELARIARTEVQAVQNAAAFQTMRELNVKYHQWVSAEDSRVRRSHQRVNGEIVAVGTRFSNRLRHPLDTSGPPEEFINCRCRAVPFIIPLGKAAPGPGPFEEGDLIDIQEALES